MSDHDVPSPVDSAMQETVAAYAEELRAHVELAQAWRTGESTGPARGAYAHAKNVHVAALSRLRRVLDEAGLPLRVPAPGVQDEP